MVFLRRKMPENNTLKYRVEQLEKNYYSLDSKMEKLMTNDIPHLNQAMASLKVRMDVLTVVNVGAIIFGLIISKMF